MTLHRDEYDTDEYAGQEKMRYHKTDRGDAKHYTSKPHKAARKAARQAKRGRWED